MRRATSSSTRVAARCARPGDREAGHRGRRPAVDQIDGFTSSALFPSAGNHAVEDGVSTVSSAWLAQRLGVNPRYASGFQGNGQLPGSVALAVNAIASGAADYVLVHRALHNPAGSYHGNPMQHAAGAMQWTVPQGFFGPLAMIGLTYNEYLQRFGASPRGHGARAGRSPQERGPDPVVVLARPPARGPGLSRLAHARRSDPPAGLRHPCRRGAPLLS